MKTQALWEKGLSQLGKGEGCFTLSSALPFSTLAAARVYSGFPASFSPCL